MARRGRRAGALVLTTMCLIGTSSALAAKPDAAASTGYVVVLLDGIQDPAAATDDLQRRDGFTAHLRYASALKGFSAQLSDEQAARLRGEPSVAYVVPDVTFHA